MKIFQSIISIHMHAIRTNWFELEYRSKICGHYSGKDNFIVNNLYSFIKYLYAKYNIT